MAQQNLAWKKMARKMGRDIFIAVLKARASALILAGHALKARLQARMEEIQQRRMERRKEREKNRNRCLSIRM